MTSLLCHRCLPQCVCLTLVSVYRGGVGVAANDCLQVQRGNMPPSFIIQPQPDVQGLTAHSWRKSAKLWWLSLSQTRSRHKNHSVVTTHFVYSLFLNTLSWAETFSQIVSRIHNCVHWWPAFCGTINNRAHFMWAVFVWGSSGEPLQVF